MFSTVVSNINESYQQRDRHEGGTTNDSSCPSAELEVVQPDMVTIRGDIAVSWISVLARVLGTRPLLLELLDDGAMQPVLLGVAIETRNLPYTANLSKD